MRWLLVVVLASGCAKSLEDLYPFRCPTMGDACPLAATAAGSAATCDPNVGCTFHCSDSADCVGADGSPRFDLACVTGVCELSCTDENGDEDASRCPDSYTCMQNAATGNGMFTCIENHNLTKTR